MRLLRVIVIYCCIRSIRLIILRLIILNGIYIKKKGEDLFHSFLVHGHSAKELLSKFSKETDGNGLLSAHAPFRMAGRRWRLSRMSQAMSQPQPNESELIRKCKLCNEILNNVSDERVK